MAEDFVVEGLEGVAGEDVVDAVVGVVVEAEGAVGGGLTKAAVGGPLVEDGEEVGRR